ncbi:MAG: M14 family metallopeptidase [Gemmatimonadota bacterium]
MRAVLAPMRASCPRWTLAFVVLLAAPATGQWRDARALGAGLAGLAQANAARATLVTIATSPGGRAVQALRIGGGADVTTRPALLVVANAYGPHLVGSEIALTTAQRLLQGYGRDSAITRLLNSTTIWFIPRLNPDAAEGMLGAVKWERVGNGTASDDDHDQLTDEDGPDDLDGNGLITSMRVADPNGEWVADSLEPGLMRRADASKGEVGRFRLLGLEGKDDDGDGKYNEDAIGGTDINRNFAYNYLHHGTNAGAWSFAATETRGFADFLIAHPEIAAVYVLGPQDNLMAPWTNRPSMGIADPQGNRSPEGTSAGGQLNSILRADEATFADAARRFQKTTGLSKGPASAPLAGDVLSFLYYDFGRWAFGSRGWWVPEAPRDSAARGRPGTTGGNDPLSEERNAFHWFRANEPDALVPWHAVTLAGESRAVEAGGFAPGAMLNPPTGAQLDSTLARQERFIVELAGMLPRVALRDVKAEALGDGVWRISASVANEGVLPTATALGARLRNPRGVRVDLDAKGGEILSGQKVQLLQPIPGGGRSTRLEWTLTGARGATVELRAGSPVTGTSLQTISLR